MEQCCGICTWLKDTGAQTYLVCGFQVPTWVKNRSVLADRSVTRDEGKRCPCFSPREEAGS